MTPRDERKHPEAVRITTAAPSKAEEIAARQRRYLYSMAVRTLCVIGAVVADGWLRWVLIAGAVVLPYVAVVMANAAKTRQDDFELQGGYTPGRELDPPSGPEAAPGHP
jgi:hypothetical protein